MVTNDMRYIKCTNWYQMYKNVQNSGIVQVTKHINYWHILGLTFFTWWNKRHQKYKNLYWFLYLLHITADLTLGILTQIFPRTDIKYAASSFPNDLMTTYVNDFGPETFSGIPMTWYRKACKFSPCTGLLK